MNVTRTTRFGMILLFGWSCTVAVYAGAPAKLNLPLGTQRNVNYLKFSPDSSRVLYLADQEADDVFEIYSVPSSGGSPEKLNAPLSGGRDVLAAGLQFSPDGSRVLYYANQDATAFFEIYSVPATGGTPVKLNGPLTTGGNVSSDGLQFSPDGQTVLYRAKPGFFDPTELFIAPTTGTAAPIKLNGALVSGGNVASTGLRFSPDSAQVLYVADQAADEVNELFVVPSTGGTATKLSGPMVLGGDVLPGSVSFSPDGSRVVYLADQLVDARIELFSVPSQGGTPVKLNGTLVSGGNVSSTGLQVSFNGSQVLYVADQMIDQVDELFLVASNGGTPLKLNGSLVSGGDVIPGGVHFSPDGSRVLYLADQEADDVFEIYSVPSSGGASPEKLNAPLSGGRDVSAAGLQFSPDGSRVLYYANQDTTAFFEIYSVPATGGTPVKLNGPLTTGGNVSSDGLQFSPDGQTVLYRAKPGFFDPTELFIVPSTGGTPVKLNGSLVNGGNVTSLGLQFSPDGSRVLYRADQDMDEVFEIYSRVVRQHWNGNVGDWNVAANWDQLQTPDEAMRIVIDQPAVVTLPTGAPDAMVGELSIGGGAGISTLRLEAGTTLSAVNGLTVLSGGIIRGEGAIQAEVTVEPGGMLAPGFSQGILEIDRLTMYTNSMLEIEIAGRDAELEYDQLLVGHEATLEGMLSVALLSSFTPAPNDTFTILTSANLAGSFANAANGSRLNTSGGDGSFLVNYNAETNNVTLSDFMSSLSLMGDYNRDNVIDAADYTVWRDALTAGGTSLPNDPTPGTVDESDFLYWREHFGESLGSGAGGGSPAAVPEPTALVLALIAWTGLLYWADARRRLAV